MSSCAALAALVVVLASAAPALATRTMAVQPDGKILLAGRAYPNNGAITRLNPDGAVDVGFGNQGVAVDRRFTSFSAVALRSENRIVAAAPGGSVKGFQLAGFLSDGLPDPGFGTDGAGGGFQPGSGFALRALEPVVVFVRPDGRIVVGGDRRPEASPTARQATAQLFSSDGNLVETVGALPGPPETPPLFETGLTDLVPLDDGSLMMAGYNYMPQEYSGPLLARFIPGSGTPYDKSFAGGEGLDRAPSPPSSEARAARAIALDGEKLIVAGSANGSLLVSRFDLHGNPDATFGREGFANPPVEGTSGSDGSTDAAALAIQEDGRIAVAGTTTKWGSFYFDKYFGLQCYRCTEMIVADLLPGGGLDPTFGDDGLARVRAPGDGQIVARAEELIALPGGKLLLRGGNEEFGTTILARLNPDGSLDPTFGEGGIVTLPEPCLAGNAAALRSSGCRPAARVKVRLSGLKSGHPALSLRVRPNVSWAEIHDVRVRLPRELAGTGHFGPGKVRLTLSGGESQSRKHPGGRVEEHNRSTILFRALGLPTLMRTRLSNGALRTVGRPAAGRELVFRVTVKFSSYKLSMGEQTLAIRARG